MSAAVEEQMVVKAIRDECPWESLPKRLQSTLQTKDEWHRRLAGDMKKPPAAKMLLEESTSVAPLILFNNDNIKALHGFLGHNGLYF